jgi:hypothetical protein
VKRRKIFIGGLHKETSFGKSFFLVSFLRLYLFQEKISIVKSSFFFFFKKKGRGKEKLKLEFQIYYMFHQIYR